MTDAEQDHEYLDPEPRLPRGYLETDVDIALREYAAGEHKLPEGKYLTPYRVGTILIADTDGERKRPSTGAISAVFDRMVDAGYIECRREPYAFTKFSDLGRLSGSWLNYQAGQDQPS